MAALNFPVNPTDGQTYVANDRTWKYSSATGSWSSYNDPAPGMNWLGGWNAATAYNLNDSVFYNGSSWIALAASTGVNPGTDVTKWDLLAARGQDGTNGADGTPGAPGYSPNAVLTGGGVAWTSERTFTVSAASYIISNKPYSSPQTTVVLAAPDLAYARIDIIAVTSSSTVVVLTGVASDSPEEPDVDPTSQLQLSFIYVPVVTAPPINAALTDLYHEGSGGEWTATSSGAGVVINSTNNPHLGTKCIEATALTTQYFQFAVVAPFDVSTRNNLVFFIRSKAAWPNAKQLTIRWQMDGTTRGSSVSFKDGTFGFVSSNTTAYQQIVIPLNLFGVTGIQVNQLRFTTAGGGSNLPGFYFDDVTLQGGVNQTSSGSAAMVWRGDWNAAAAYVKNDVVTLSGATWVALQPNTGVTPVAGDTWALVAAGPFDATVFYPGKPLSLASVMRVPIARTVLFPGNFAGSYGVASANATTSTVFSITRDGTAIGTATFASGTAVAAFVSTGGTAQTFAAGNVLAVVAPSTQDATLTDVGFVLAGTR